jgi:hypothetical protein
VKGDSIGEQLAALRGQLDQVLAEIRELKYSHCPADRRLPELLRAIREVEVEEEFAAAWLVDDSTDDLRAGAAALRGLLASIMGRGPGRGRVKRLGHFLARHAGASAGGLRLERVGDSRDGATYKVAEVARAIAAHATIPPA